MKALINLKWLEEFITKAEEESYEGVLDSNVEQYLRTVLDETSKEDLIELLKYFFFAGFEYSSEGFNGEYPFEDLNKKPKDNADLQYHFRLLLGAEGIIDPPNPDPTADLIKEEVKQ